MNSNKSQSNRSLKGQKQQDNFRGPTKLPGQNPQANDDPSHDEHHDEIVVRNGFRRD